LQDLGVLGFTLPEVAMLMPPRKPRSHELTVEQHLANQVLHQRRLRIEPVNSSVKHTKRHKKGCYLGCGVVAQANPEHGEGAGLSKRLCVNPAPADFATCSL
jgi:hypothetical protein